MYSLTFLSQGSWGLFLAVQASLNKHKMVSKRRKSSGINAILQRKLGCSLDINEIDKSDLNNVSKFFLLSFNFVSNYLKKKSG